jgi:23S rRNA (cytidine1920-2'-O)/16S rRNA (cytidine1409-2'-O)-methyltransferase
LKERLDKVLVLKGVVKSRELAKALIMEGNVFVNGEKITKSGTLVKETSEIFLKESGLPYVSRGGVKLEAALNFFEIDVQGKVIMDVGSSTGGFTDCVLQRGAKKVYCIDVGYGQLAWSLRKDPRVVLLERTNIRYLDKEILEGKTYGKKEQARYSTKKFEDLVRSKIDISTIDVSFISLTKVILPVSRFLKTEGEILALVKPQFEVGKGEVGKGGIVREEEKRLQSVRSVQAFSEEYNFTNREIFQSPIQGQKGNIEYFLLMRRRDYVTG